MKRKLFLLLCTLLGLLSSVQGVKADVDKTSSVSTTWKRSDGTTNAGTTAEQYSPKATPFGASEGVLMNEVYETTTATTGIILQQTISGLENGIYKVELYANAMYTNRTEVTQTSSVAEARVYLFANTTKKQVTAQEAESTTANGEYVFYTTVTDGTLHLGMRKDAAGTNWHNIQINRLTYKGTEADLTELIVNPTINNDNNQDMPEGWGEFVRTNAGNNNRTEGTGDTQLEGYAPIGTSDFEVDYYQTISNLTEGWYSLTARVHDRDEAGAVLYIFSNSGGSPVKKSVTMTTDYSVMTTPMIYVADNGSVNIGIQVDKKHGTWFTGDDFKLTFYGKTLNVPLDLTARIVNPSFETGNTVGWSAPAHDDTGAKRNDNALYTMSNVAGEYLFNTWASSIQTLSISQTVTGLPKGYYTLSAVLGGYNDKSELKIIGNGQTGSLANENETTVGTLVSTEVAVGDDGNLVIQAENKGLGCSLLKCDDFKLVFQGNLSESLTTLQGTIDESYLDNATYANVTGEERTVLTTAKTLTAASETASAYEAAIASVQGAIDKFVEAKTNYDALASVNTKITAVGTLEYASSAKKPSTYNATSSSDAAAHAASLTTELRAYVESNALAEGVDGATDYTGYIQNATCPGPKTDSDKEYSSAAGWDLSYIRFDGGSGWTGSETNHDVYYGSNGYFWGNFTGSRTVTMTQVVSDLPAGRYLLTVRAKSSGAIPTFFISGNGVQQNITHPNGVFGNGWDDNSVTFTVGNSCQATILLKAQKESDGTVGHWFNADNFRLVRLGDATVSATIGSAGWTTFASPYALNLNGMTASEGDVKAYYASSMGDGKVTMTSTSQVGVQAGEGLMLKGNAGATITIPIEPSGTGIDGNKMKGCLVNTEITSATENYATFYVLVNGTDGAEFQNIKKYCDGGQTVTVPAGKAYLDATALAGARLTIVFNEDGFTGINAVEAAEAETGALKDGKYLINGKIVLVKNGVKYGANGQKLN